VDPISIIVGALAAGALAGAQDVASSSIKDSYERLKSLLRDRFGGRVAAETALDEHGQDPESWEPALRSELLKAGVDADHQVVEHAQALLNWSAPRVRRVVTPSTWTTAGRGGNSSVEETRSTIKLLH